VTVTFSGCGVLRRSFCEPTLAGETVNAKEIKTIENANRCPMNLIDISLNRRKRLHLK
jgi:hypothetical protein